MATISRGGADYIGYEYKEKIVPKAHESLYMDSYPCFGWEEDPNRFQREENAHIGYVSLHFRRDRKICNKTELTRLQRNFDGCVSQIDNLERIKTTIPTIWSIGCGIVGTAFMAGSVFAITAQQPLYVLSVILAVPAFMGWLMSYFIYRVMLQKQEEKMAPLIEDKYDEISIICEKGSKLLI